MKQVSKKLRLKRMVLVVLVGFLLLYGVIGSRKANAATTYPYLLKVNKQQNVITAYKKDKKGKYSVPVKAMVCSVGVDTPIGTFKTPVNYRWRLLDGDVWGQYSTRIVRGILFHSVWYYEKNPSTLSAKQYNKLGTTASHGCVRVTVEDAKWIYDNCPIGTTVTIYNSKNPGPLGKPQAIKLPEGTGWDPTDVSNKDNPYNEKKPVILGAKNKTVKYKSKVNLTKGITAKSTTGLFITSDMKVKGKVNTSESGTYKITYSVTDLLGRKAKKTVNYIVLPDTSKPVITGVADRIIGKDTIVDRKFVLEGVKATLSKKVIKVSDIKTDISKNEDDTYTITYSITAPNGKTTTAKSTLTVDSEAPQFIGVKAKEIAWDTKVDETNVLEGIEITDNYSKMKQSDIIVKTEENQDGSYTVTYEAADEVGNIVTQSVVFTITDFLQIEGVSHKTVPIGYIVDEAYVKQGITARDKNIDITWKLTASILESEDNVYLVTYSVKDDLGHEEIATATFTLEKEKLVQ